MCGISGFLSGSGPVAEDEARARLERMGLALRHRGPDSFGLWADPEAGLGFSHRRLAIVDLTPAGAQPMHSPSGRWVLTFNGEIYNHMELRDELQQTGCGVNWKGHSDTETFLAGIDAWGVEATLKRVVGMFALALWDRERKELVLARDRLGEKPLFYGWQGKGAERTLLFGSELKALARHPAFGPEVNRDALALFMRYGYVPAPHSIYRDIGKIVPGTFLTLSARDPEGEMRAYWSADAAVAAGIADPLQVSESEAIDGLEALLLDAVGKQLMSDVPLGAFLSGGLDSSTIVAMMQKQSAQPVRTFTIGFEDQAFDEARYARAVAAHLGTDHTELYVTPVDALGVIPRLAAMYDEPFADSSQIPTFLVSELARRHVTVALSGDGGDELFGGYERYPQADRLWRKVGLLPRPLRRAAGAAIRAVPKPVWNRVGRVAGMRGGYSAPGESIHKAGRLLGSASAAELGLAIGDRWNGSGVVLGAAPAPGLLEGRIDPGRSAVDRMMAVDLQTYLPDDILAKVDRAAMAVSLETRVPFLDHRVVEYAWRLPLDYKFRPGRTKWAVRELLCRHVPRELVERPKMGFSVPVHSWLRGPLREWAEDLLDENRLRAEGFFRPGRIRQAWQDHQSGRANLQAQLWTVLMFQSWLRSPPQPVA